MVTNIPPRHFGCSLSTAQSDFRCPAVVSITWAGGGVEGAALLKGEESWGGVIGRGVFSPSRGKE